MRARPRLTDRMLPLVVAAVQVAANYGAQDNQPDRLPADALGVFLLVAGALALALRRSHPVLTLVLTTATMIVFISRGHAYGPVFFAPGIAIFTAILHGHRQAAWATAAVDYVFFLVHTTWLAPIPSPGLWHSLAIAAVMGVLLSGGEFVRVRRERAAERERAEQEHRAEQERTAREEARRQASEERLTMAQELHDVLAHNISLIHVQASTALHLIDDHPEQARTALTAIKQASKEVLTEMRSLIGVLRDGAPRSPAGGLDRLEELIGRSRLDVTRRVAGRVRPLPSGVDLAGYRIVQESLTNAVRHAPGSAVEVLLEYGPHELLIRITDSGGGTPAESLGGGNGIPGMKERAAALGGTLTAARHGQGFRVEARLPIPEETRDPRRRDSVISGGDDI